jgi:hypothetical protein
MNALISPMTPLIARLRVGSVLTTQRGATYRVVEPILQVARNSSLVPTFVVERTWPGNSPHTVLRGICCGGDAGTSAGSAQQLTGARRSVGP